MGVWQSYIENQKAVDYVNKIIDPYNLTIKVSRPRKTKLGDYRPPYRTNNHRISINNNLNRYSFLITLIHEIAHMIVWEQHKNKVKSHGVEWQRMHYELLLPFIEMDFFPNDVVKCILKNGNNIKAGVHSEAELTKILSQYDRERNSVFVEDLEELNKFDYRGRIFVVQQKMRKRYKCLEISTRKQYLFSPVAEVKLVEN